MISVAKYARQPSGTGARRGAEPAHARSAHTLRIILAAFGFIVGVMMALWPLVVPSAQEATVVLVLAGVLFMAIAAGNIVWIRRASRTRDAQQSPQQANHRNGQHDSNE